MEKTLKEEARKRNLSLTDGVVRELTKQGLDKGYKNFKKYAEHLLIEQSKVK